MKGVQAGPTTAVQAQRVASLELVSWAVAKKIKFAGVRPEVREGTRGMFATYNVPGVWVSHPSWCCSTKGGVLGRGAVQRSLAQAPHPSACLALRSCAP